MIGKLTGLVDSTFEDHLILDVQGVGYLVQCSGKTLQKLPPKGGKASLIIDTHVREDAIRLYGFSSDEEREWFRILLNVQGVGAKVALSILSLFDSHGLATALSLQNKAAIGRAAGVGPKLAQRLVTELKDKAPSYISIDPDLVKAAQDIGNHKAPKPLADAISALVNLGYGQPQATAAVVAAHKLLGEGAETSALIRQGLKELS